MTFEISPETLQEYGEVYETLEHILSTIEMSFASANVPLPDRRFTAVGDVGASVAVDCAQLNVNFVQSYFGNPGQPTPQATGCMMLMSGDFVIQLWRCVPAPKLTQNKKYIPPDVNKIEASTLVQSVDGQILLQSAWAMTSAQPRKALVSATGSQGAYQAMQLSLNISLSRG